MARNSTNTEITAPVSVTDVKTVLAVNSNNVGYLCSNKHGKINRWSKFKPVTLAQDFPNRALDWWKGTAGDCGLTVIKTNDYSQIPSLYTEILMTDGWPYEPPTGHFHLADFEGYKHDARPPFSGFNCTTKTAQGYTFQANFAGNLIGTPDGPTSISLGDIRSSDGVTYLKDFYFGVLFVRPNGTIAARLTSNTAGQNWIETTTPAALIQGVSYKVYPFLSKKRIGVDEEDTMQGNEFYPFPCVRVGTSDNTLQVVSKDEAAGVSIIIRNAKYSGSTAISVQLIVRAEFGLIIQSGSITAKYTESGSAASVGEPGAIFKDKSLGNNGEFSQTFLLSTILAEKKGHYHIDVILTTNKGVFTRNGYAVMEEITGEGGL